MVASVAVLFIIRHQVVVGSGHRLRLSPKWLVPVLLFNYMLYVNMTLPALFTAPEEQLSVKMQLLKEERCPPKSLLHPSVFILQSSMNFLLPYLAFLIVFVGAECGLLALHCSWLLFFSTLTQKLSRKTRTMQIKFLAALVAQIAIPTALCYTPIFYWAITTIIDHYWQFANDVCVFVFATYGIISSICQLLFYDSYRAHLLYILCRISKSKRMSTMISERTSRVNSIHRTQAHVAVMS
ncbi:unnamed protein product [Caenorhabditis sp. 36 PRJEB53466]|nr:unnamed protein product [Caenorhabditis sp. 36 PRJEB53466]